MIVKFGQIYSNDFVEYIPQKEVYDKAIFIDNLNVS